MQQFKRITLYETVICEEQQYGYTELFLVKFSENIKQDGTPGDMISKKKHCKASVVMASRRGQFGNPGRETSAIGSRYSRTSEKQKTRRTRCVL
jgi:hypothetical protein